MKCPVEYLLKLVLELWWAVDGWLELLQGRLDERMEQLANAGGT